MTEGYGNESELTIRKSRDGEWLGDGLAILGVTKQMTINGMT